MNWSSGNAAGWSTTSATSWVESAGSTSTPIPAAGRVTAASSSCRGHADDSDPAVLHELTELRVAQWSVEEVGPECGNDPQVAVGTAEHPGEAAHEVPTRRLVLDLGEQLFELVDDEEHGLGRQHGSIEDPLHLQLVGVGCAQPRVAGGDRAQRSVELAERVGARHHRGDHPAVRTRDRTGPKCRQEPGTHDARFPASRGTDCDDEAPIDPGSCESLDEFLDDGVSSEEHRTIDLGERPEPPVRIGELVVPTLRLGATGECGFEMLDEGLDIGVAISGVPCGRPPHHLVREHGDTGTLDVHRREPIVRRGDRPGAERELTGQKLKDQHGERKLVAGRCRRLARQQLRGFVSRRWVRRAVTDGRLDECGDAEVREVGIRLVDQDIARLDVTVHHAGSVGRRKGTAELTSNRRHRRDLHRARGESGAEVLCQQAHHDVGPTGLAPVVVDRNDVGVLEVGHELRLSIETPDEISVVRQLGADRLDRNLAAHARLHRSVHDTVSTLSERRTHSIPAQRLPGG